LFILFYFFPVMHLRKVAYFLLVSATDFVATQGETVMGRKRILPIQKTGSGQRVSVCGGGGVESIRRMSRDVWLSGKIARQAFRGAGRAALEGGGIKDSGVNKARIYLGVGLVSLMCLSQPASAGLDWSDKSSTGFQWLRGEPYPEIEALARGLRGGYDTPGDVLWDIGMANWNNSLAVAFGCGSSGSCWGIPSTSTPVVLVSSGSDVSSTGVSASSSSLEGAVLRASSSTQYNPEYDHQYAFAGALLRDWIYFEGDIPEGGYTGSLRARVDGVIEPKGLYRDVLDGWPWDREAFGFAGAAFSSTSYGGGFVSNTLEQYASGSGYGAFDFELPYTITSENRWVSVQIALAVETFGDASADFSRSFVLQPVSLPNGLSFHSQSGLLFSALPPATSVPEPTTLGLLGIGLAAILRVRRHKNRKLP
jgi:hypothetical protein